MNLAFKLPNYNLCRVFFWSKSWSTITMVYSNISNGHNWLAHMNMECWMCKFTMALIRMQSRFDMMNDKHMLQANTQGY